MVFAVWACPEPLAEGLAELEDALVASVRLARAEPAGRWLEFMESMQRHFALVDGLNLDRRQIWIATVLGLQRMAAG